MPLPSPPLRFLEPHRLGGNSITLHSIDLTPKLSSQSPQFLMNRPKIVTVFHGEVCLGEAEVFPAGGGNQPSLFHFPNNEIRISHLTPPSERCPPLAVLHSVSPSSVPFKIKARAVALAQDSPFCRLYMACFQERKTAVVLFGDQELHLVAMPSKTERSPCFWCCSIRPGLYNSCMWMLNLRCLAIVFDLDETLIVANTMRSFEDRIAALSHRIDSENDPVRVSGMSAELKRCVEDREMLKQYIENDTVMDNGRLICVQREHVPPLPGSQETVMRPVIRLPEKNVVLTRINPEIRDTSVFVRLRPAWDDLRSYLTAKGRKRFEVYVCTLAERDYALEMWRLLDPEAHLIGSKQLLDRITCVKSGFRKSLQHVFRDGNCHPKMAMVIDDRLQVWVDTDQPRVHVVPPFAPYYAPQAEMATAVPVLCVARNVACNVRGGFFKEFDDNLLKRIYEICYENEILDLPHVADVSNYLMPEDTSIPNRDPSIPEGMTGVDVERRFRPGSLGDERQAQHQPQPTHSSLSGDELSKTRLFTINGERKEVGSLTPLHSSLFIAVLQEIGRKCDSKVEFRSIIGTSKEFHFHFEVLFSSERIGIGMGRTMKEAQLQAAENALRNLASKYISFIAPSNGGVDREFGKLSLEKENGFLEDIVSPRDELSKKEGLHGVNTIEHSEKLAYVLSAIKEHCAENQSIVFVDQAPASVTLDEGEHYFQVELAGEVIAKGVGVSREEAKLKASEEALRTLKTNGVPLSQKRSVFAPLTKRPKESRDREGSQN